MKDFSFLTNSHPSFVEEMYTDFLENPDKIDPEWKKFFSGFDFAISNAVEFQQKENNETNNIASTKTNNVAQQNLFETSGNVDLQKEFAVYSLIRAYRKRGHLLSNTNPIRKRKDRNARLELSDFGLAENDLSMDFFAGNLIGLGKTSLKNIIEKLKSIYVSTVGIEYKYINNEEVCKWVEKEFEAMMQELVPVKKQKRILEKLNQGVMLEKFLHTKFIGQKRFSLEGGESTIVALDGIINASGEDVVKEVVIGMAHRGRLNVLTNILHKTYNQLFSEFSGSTPQNSTMGSGDVKYHLGFRSDVETLEGKKVNIQLMPNPSHLEAVNPVVEGFARAKADTLYKSDYDAILPILIHGDASIAGQGIVYEVLQMSNLQGYYTGGTIHFIINNQIGFTTDFDDARSADYCSSIASMVQAPVFHVNGDDPEAVLKVSELAFKFRQKIQYRCFS
jgi:2-oxoglutarate dehydrogenase E1 component